MNMQFKGLDINEYKFHEMMNRQLCFGAKEIILAFIF